ncbi:MAG TPA: CapA family protein [Bacteroidales bacterium]|nr:CapA family protein [Bacteroidales bacterium]
MEDKINIFISGDFFGSNRLEKFIIDENYDKIFHDIMPEIKNADIAITNLESPVTLLLRSINKTGPAIKANPKTMAALKYAGINLVTLANNHIMDYGAQGLTDTINSCKKNMIDFVGAGLNVDEAAKPFIITVKGKKIAFINIAENEWSTTDGKMPGANPLNPFTNFYTIQQARYESDHVFVIIHGGHEKYSLPSPGMKQLYRFFIDAGADAVIGHHTHFYSGYEIYKGRPIFYSLGNFIFDSLSVIDPRWHEGFAVKFIIDHNGISFHMIPFIQMKGNVMLRKMNSEEHNQFDQEIMRLNRIIADDNELEKHFSEFILKMKKQYLAFLEPHSNRFIYALQSRHLFPSFLSKKKRLLYRNLMRCEAHREIVLNLLEK